MADGFNFPILTPPFLTPPFNPQSGGVGNVSTSDPYAELTNLITQMQGRNLAPPPQGKLEQVLNAIAQAAAIAASPEPGTALAGTLQQRQQRKDDLFKFNAARQANLDQIKLQAAVQRATDLAREQADVRKEIRGERADIAKEQRSIGLLKQKSDIELDYQKNLTEQNELLAQRFEPFKLARERARVITQDYPQQRKDKIEMSTFLTAMLPNLDPVTADVIAAKRSGLDSDPLTPEEIDLIKQANQEAGKREKTKRDVGLASVRAQTARDIAEAEYTRAGKPGQDRFANAYQAALGRDTAQGLSGQYVRTTDGQIMTIEDAMKHPIHKYTFKPLTPQENDAEQLKAAKKVVEQRQLMGQQGQIVPETTMKGISPKAQQVMEYAKKENYTPEQTRVLLTANGINTEEINKLVPQGSVIAPTPTPQATRPREIMPLSPQNQKMMDDLMKALEKEKNKRKK
jgi:hypothetical protein